MEKTLYFHVESLHIGEPQTSKSITMFPISVDWLYTKDYLILDEALDKGLLEIREIDKEGSVPELVAITKSDIPVLLFAGQELIGAKQNRMLNTTVLLPSRSKTVIDVSCVEQGRWSYTDKRFSSGGMVMQSLRESVVMESADALRREGRPRANQGRVWDRIAERAEELQVRSPTSAQRDIFEKQTEAVRDVKRKFHIVDNQVGLLVLFNKKVAGIEVFPDSQTFELIFDSLLESYIIDALDLPSVKIDRVTKMNKAKAFMDKIKGAKMESFPSVGLGSDIRLSGKSLMGFALMHRERLYHLACFSKEKQNNKTRFGSYTRRTMVL